jgi:hypothetical protein
MQKPKDTLAKLVMARLEDARQYRNNSCIFGGKSIDSWFDVVDCDYNKIHSDCEKKAYPEMTGYFGLTNLKIDAAVAHVKTKYAHAVDAPFVFDISENPELDEDDEKWVTAQLDLRTSTTMRDMQLTYEPAGSSRSVLQENRILKPSWLKFTQEQREEVKANQIELRIQKAREAANYHQSYVKDQLHNPSSGWSQTANTLFFDLLKDPYCVIAGNEYRSVTDTIWSGNGIKFVNKVVPTWRRVDPRNVYISSDSSSAQDGQGVTEIIERSKNDLIALKELSEELGYKHDEIDKLINECGIQKMDWLGYGYTDKTGWADASQTTLHKIACLVHQGLLSGDELSKHGVTGYGKAKDAYFNCSIEICNGRTIRCQVIKAPDNRRNYFSASYTVNGNYHGVSPAMKLHDRQVEINRLMFSKARNQHAASGATLFPNAQFFEDPENFNLEPYEVHWAKPQMSGQPNGRAIDTFQVQANFRLYHAEIRDIMILADEECGIPSMFSGLSRGGVSNSTLGGAVLQQTNGELGMESAIINLDKQVIEPMFTQTHLYNLQSKDIPKHYKRGDLQVMGRGIYGKKQEEMKNRAMAQFLPRLDADAASGIVPKPMLKNAMKQIYAGQGFDTSYMQGGMASNEVDRLTAPPQTGLSSTDNRTYNQQQNMIGAFQ